MAFHPTGVTVDIVGTESNTQGRSCEEHGDCESKLCEDAVVRSRKVQVIINGKEESAIRFILYAMLWRQCFYWRCIVGGMHILFYCGENAADGATIGR
jgi:hypothetical protein